MTDYEEYPEWLKKNIYEPTCIWSLDAINKSLSLEAKGLLIFISTIKEGLQPSFAEVAQYLGISERKLRKLKKELNERITIDKILEKKEENTLQER